MGFPHSEAIQKNLSLKAEFKIHVRFFDSVRRFEVSMYGSFAQSIT